MGLQSRITAGGRLGAVLALGLVLAACTSGGSSTPAQPAAQPTTGSTAAASGPAAPAAGSARASLTCDAQRVGPVVRCENFYDDYWPVMKARMAELAEQARGIEGGQIMVWTFNELDPREMSAFEAQYPGLKLVTQGLRFNLSAAIITAEATGQRTSDIVKGSIVTAQEVYDAGFWRRVDWTEYGVPREWLDPGAPEMLPDSISAYTTHFNSAAVPTVPEQPPAFLGADWKDKLATQGFRFSAFGYYGLKYGEPAMKDYIRNLLTSGNMTVTDNPLPLLSSGDRPVLFPATTLPANANPALKVAPYDGMGIWLQFSGVNAKARNTPGAIVYALWNAYDPDYQRLRATDPALTGSPTPFPGLPTKTMNALNPTQAMLYNAYQEGLRSGQGVYETTANRDQLIALLKSADDTYNQFRR